MRQYIQDLFDAFERGKRFVAHDVWHIGGPGDDVPAGFIIKQIRVTILLVQNLVRDMLPLRASALTFATALGIIPFLAMIFFIIQTFQVDEEIYSYLSSKLEQYRGEQVLAADQAPREWDLRQALLDFLSQGVGQVEQTADGKPLDNPIKSIMEYAQKGANAQAIGLVGLFFVLTTVFGLMNNIESSFNTIWGIRDGRTWFRMLSDYLSLMVVLPFVVALVLSVTAVLESGQVRSDLGHFAFALRGVQYVIIWLVFTAMYFFVPNARVQFRYALLGGVVAGTGWCLLSWAYVKFQVGLPNYSLFYSTFAQIPVLLMWVYSSWLVLLFGAELTFAYQYEKTFAMERLSKGASYAYREAVGLWAMIEMGKRFDEGKPPLRSVEFAEKWNVPTRLLNDTLSILEAGGLVSQCGADGPAFQPGRSLTRIAVGDIVNCLRESGRDPSALREQPAFRALLDGVCRANADAYRGTLAELVEKVRAHEVAGEAATSDDAKESPGTLETS